VESCLVLRTSASSGWPPALLCALELAGIERIYALPEERLPQLIAHMQGHDPSGVVLSLGDCGLSGLHGKLPRLIRLSPPRAVALWSDETTSWDEAAIAFAHPRLHILQQGLGDASPSIGSKPASRAWSALMQEDVDALFVPTRLMPSALQHHHLVLGPGQEPCWVWPELTRDVFLERRLAWFESEDSP
jgi:hypothetical protein